MKERADGRQYRSEEEWREILLRFEGSTEEVQEFCKQEGIDKSGLYRWRRKLGSPSRRRRRAQFIELSPAAVEQQGEANSIELELPHGIILRVRC